MSKPGEREPLRVLFVCQGDLTRASTKQAVAFADGLIRAGHSVLLSLYGDPSSVDLEQISPHPNLKVAFRTEYGYLLAKSTIRTATEFDPHILHLFNPRHYTVHVAKRLKAATQAAIVVHWEDDEIGIRKGVAKRTMIRRAGRAARRVICYPLPRNGLFVTRSSLEWVRRNAAACDALTPALAASVQEELNLPCTTVLPGPPRDDVDSSDGGSLEAYLPTAPGAAVVAYTGSVHPESIDDFRLAARAMARIVDLGHDVYFLHAGHVAGGRYDLDAVVGHEGLPADRFIGLGYVPFNHLRLLLRKASVLIQPGRPNRFNRLRLPSKVQAYLESGRPTVMFSVGLGELLADRIEVLKLYEFDVDELSSAILELISDRVFADRIGAGGASAARRLFNAERTTTALLACYARALGGWSPSPSVVSGAYSGDDQMAAPR